MPTYVQRPRPLEAFEWTGDYDALCKWGEEVSKLARKDLEGIFVKEGKKPLFVDFGTSMSQYLKPGDYVVYYKDGEFDAMSKDIFEFEYMPVETPA